jgi:hypothetical protein
VNGGWLRAAGTERQYVPAALNGRFPQLWIREIVRLRKRYGRGRWRKRKGTAEIELPNGEIVWAELHWYEATGIGRREFKIKRLL